MLAAASAARHGVTAERAGGRTMSGVASWYAHGWRTASGERFQPGGLTAAHRWLPFGTRVLVRHRITGRTVEVTINDRGPFVGGRIIDLSRGAAARLGMGGTAPVELHVISRGHHA
jgi:rare lipoprotein A